jgi:hypothetical protein
MHSICRAMNVAIISEVTSRLRELLGFYSHAFEDLLGARSILMGHMSILSMS